MRADRGGLAAADGADDWLVAPAAPRPGCWAVPELQAAMAPSRSAVNVIRADALSDVLLDVLPGLGLDVPTDALTGALLQEPKSRVVDWNIPGRVTLPFCHAAPRGYGAAWLRRSGCGSGELAGIGVELHGFTGAVVDEEACRGAVIVLIPFLIRPSFVSV